MDAIKGLEPGIRIDQLWQRWQGRQMRKGGAWWLVAAGERLIGTLHVIVQHEQLGGGLSLRQVAGSIKGEALLLIGAMIAFDKRILLGMVRITDVHVNAQTRSEAQEGGGKVTASRTADESRGSRSKVILWGRP
jgi:hypothetical protein